MEHVFRLREVVRCRLGDGLPRQQIFGLVQSLLQTQPFQGFRMTPLHWMTFEASLDALFAQSGMEQQRAMVFALLHFQRVTGLDLFAFANSLTKKNRDAGASEGIYLLNRFAVGMLVLAWQISRDDQHLVVSEEAFHKAS
jgi:hypothetical protein